MSRPTLQLSSSIQLEDFRIQPTSLTSPTEKDNLKPYPFDSNFSSQIVDLESPTPTPKPSLTSLDHIQRISKARLETRYQPEKQVDASLLPNLRINFMRKVLAILFLQLGVTAAAIGVTFIEDFALTKFMATNFPMVAGMAALNILSLCFLVCKKDWCRKVPRNYLLLFTYTIANAYLLGSLAALTQSKIVLYAGCATIFVVLTISVYACTVKTELTHGGMGLTTFCTTVTIVFIVAILLRGSTPTIFSSALIAFGFGLHLTFSLRRLTGKYEVQYSLDDYIIAALDIYVDIVQIFMAMINIFKRGM